MNKLPPAGAFVQVLDTRLFAGDIDTATDIIVEISKREAKNNYCISATGAHGMVIARQNKTFRDILSKFYLNLPDGMPGVWVGRLKGAHGMGRCYGPDVFKLVMTKTKDLNVRHFFCGGTDGVANLLRDAVEKKFGNGMVCGTICPPFLSVEKYDYLSMAREINAAGADIVWIGLSTPKQEEFAMRLSLHTNVNFIIAVGAAFDFHIDRVAQAPSFLQRLGLEWFFRLLMEPKRLYRRYLEIVPLFLYYNFKEFFTFEKK